MISDYNNLIRIYELQYGHCKRVILPSQSYIKKETKEQFSLNDKELKALKKAAFRKYNSTNEYVSRDAIVIVFLLNTGQRVTAKNMQRSLTRLVKRAGITKNITLHTLRHTYGSTLLRRGVPIEVVSSLMGHANISITYNKYIHVLHEERVKAVDAVLIC